MHCNICRHIDACVSKMSAGTCNKACSAEDFYTINAHNIFDNVQNAFAHAWVYVFLQQTIDLFDLCLFLLMIEFLQSTAGECVQQNYEDRTLFPTYTAFTHEWMYVLSSFNGVQNDFENTVRHLLEM